MLHKSKLADFIQWLKNRGWKPEITKGHYEVLRMRWSETEPPLIVYEKNEAKEHYTTFGIGQDLLIQWLRERKS